MAAPQTYLGFAALALFVGGVPALAATDGAASTSSATMTSSSSNTMTAAVPAAPIPAGTAPDGRDTKRPFTITATLREEYDDNIFTSKDNRKGSFITSIAPTLLVELPTTDGDFSARYTIDGQYYSDRPGGQLDLNQYFVSRFSHTFSERYSMDLAEQFSYTAEPGLFDGNSTQYRNGAYYSNTINGNFNAQWTPLVSTVSSYANTIIRYEDNATATQQNSQENTGSESIGFAILPKINLVFGGIIDDISYNDITRGYTSYTGNTGIDWQILPTLSVSGRIGGQVTDAEQSGTSVSPYGSLNLGWTLGARSSLTFAYSHSVVPSDNFVSEGQIADRFTALFRYDISRSITLHLQGILTHGEYSDSLLAPNTVSSFTEDDYAIDTGAAFHYNKYLDFETGYTFSGVSSGENYRDYICNQFYVGVRGTY